MPSPATISCTRCNGTGEYHGTRRDGSSYIGACFNCRPSAWRNNVRYRPRVFQSGPSVADTTLAVHLASPARIRGLTRANGHVEAFAVAYPTEHEWLVANAPTVNFAASLLSGIRRYGNLTPRQLTAVQRNLPTTTFVPDSFEERMDAMEAVMLPAPATESDESIAAQRHLVDNAYGREPAIGTGMDGQPVTEAQVQAVAPVSLSSLVPTRPIYVAPAPRPTIDATAMRAALLAARTSGLRKPRLTLGLFEFRLGRVGSDRAETIFVYTRHAIRSLNWTFAGSILNNDLWIAASVRYGNPPMTDEQMALIRDAAVNPRNAAAAHGHDTTHCSCCRRLLTDPPSVMAGIGPVCIRRFGWL